MGCFLEVGLRGQKIQAYLGEETLVGWLPRASSSREVSSCLLEFPLLPCPPPPPSLLSIAQLTVGIHMISFPTYLIVFPKLLFTLHHLPPTKNPVLYFISTCKDTNYVHSACLCRQSTFSLSLRSCIPLLIDPGLPISDPLGTRFPRRKVPLLSAPP